MKILSSEKDKKYILRTLLFFAAKNPNFSAILIVRDNKRLNLFILLFQ
jgi:hypothetical protein